MATLTVTQSEDYRDGNPPIPFNVTDIVFNTSGFAAAIFGSNQFGIGSISNSVRLTGDGFANFFTVRLSTAGSFSAAAWTFTNWAPADRVNIEGTAGADTITGSDQADNVTGGGGADTLQGGAGADLFIFGTAGDAVAGESIDGGEGNDRLAVGGGASHDFSGVALASLESLSFADDSNTTAIFADSQIGAGAIASIFGSAGTNALVVNGQSVDLSGVSFSSWIAGTDTVTINGNNLNVNTLVGSSERDTIIGGNLLDTITGGGGLDVLSGGGGNDTFRYLAGSDVVAGESVDGGAGTDTIRLVNTGDYDFTGVALSNLERLNLSGEGIVATFSSTQIGAGAISQVVGAAGIQSLFVNAVSDVDLSALTFTDWTSVDIVGINGSAAGEALTGSNQADFIIGGDGADTMNGGGGDDSFLIGAGDFDSGESIDGGAGTDTLLISAAGSFVNFTAGTLTGIEALKFEADGEARFNASSFGPGQISSVRGSDGDNRVTIEGASALDLSSLVLVNWNEPGDRFIIFGTAAADIITGTEGRDSNIQGNGGADTLNGGAGDDTFRFLFSNDVVAGEIIDGGTGTDTLVTLSDSDFSVATLSNLEGVTIGDPVFGPATATFLSTQVGAGRITSIRAENSTSRLVVIAASNVDLSALTFSQWSTTNTVTIHGTAGSETLIGSSQNDIIEGGGGADLLYGGAGADRTEGGLGDDWHFVDNAADLVIELPGEGNDRIFASVNYVLGAGQSIETISTTANAGTTAINLTGNALGQTIVGNAGANVLTGGGGGDVLIGLGGDDTLIGSADAPSTLQGGLGNDTYRIANASDTILEFAGEGTDRIYTSVSHTLPAGREIESIFAADPAATTALNLTGNAFGQVLFGNAGANTLIGGGGSDYLIGGAGDDLLVGNADANSTLQGGTGDDRYYVSRTGDSIIEFAGEGNDRVLASVSYTLTPGKEIEILSTTSSGGTDAINLTGNEFAQTIIGNNGANILAGAGGADNLAGFGGADILAGGEGGDVLNGGAGNDILNGGAGADLFIFADALAANVDLVQDFVSGLDRLFLENAVFTGLPTGALAANAFRVGNAALDADDRIIYNPATGALLFDADGNGASAAIQFATLGGAPALAASDFTVI